MTTPEPSGTPVPPDTTEDLSFDRVDHPEAAESWRCTSCNEELRDAYFELNGLPACERCRYQAEAEATDGGGFGRLLRATIAGTLAGITGALLYWAIAKLTDREFAIIAILVGLMVGWAVRWGSHGRGGWAYQTLAVALTYIAIVASYVPFVFAGLAEQLGDDAVVESTEGDDSTDQAATAEGEASADSTESVGLDAAQPVDFGASGQEAGAAGSPVLEMAMFFGVLLALPFLSGFENFMGWIIIAIGLYQAWKMNKRQQLVISGPFRIGEAPATTG